MKTIDPTVRLLQRVPELAGLGTRGLRAVAPLVDDWDIAAGEVFIHQGTVGREAFIVVDGQAEVLVDDNHVATIGPGEFVGEMAMLDNRPRCATVRADTPLRVLVAGPSAFPSLMAHPHIARAIAVQLSERLRRAESA